MADIADIVEQVSQRLKEIRKEWLAWSLRQCSTQDRESSQSPGYVNLVTPHTMHDITQNHPGWKGGWKEKQKSTQYLVNAHSENWCKMTLETPHALY